MKLRAWILRIALAVVPTFLIGGALYAQSIVGGGGDYGLVMYGGGAVANPPLAPDGTTALPGYAYSGATGTGMYRSGNTLGWSVGGSSVLTTNNNGTLTSSGAIGISGANSYIQSGSSGVVTLSDNVDSSFSQLKLGPAFQGQLLGRLTNAAAAVPAEPVACAAGTLGVMVVINDTNDGAVTHVCYCGQQSDDSTYDWLKVTDNTACAEF
jgi:hypothetical protein